jgi:hypothetical protein
VDGRSLERDTDTTPLVKKRRQKKRQLSAEIYVF